MKLGTLCLILSLTFANDVFATDYSLSTFFQRKDVPSITRAESLDSLTEDTKSDIEELASKFKSLEIVKTIGEDEHFYEKLSKLLSGATNVCELSLRTGDLQYLPKEICNLVKLQELNLRQNLLIELPAEIEHLSNLLALDLSLNQLTELPGEIGGLINLQEMYLRMNRLTSLPKEIGNWQNLYILDLSLNQLMELPAEIGDLASLRSLYLSLNQLTVIPKEIGNLSNLRTLDLGLNQLTELPKEVGNLTNLQILDLHDNNLTALPKEIGNLPNLCILDFERSGMMSVLNFNNELDTQLNLKGKGLTQIPFDIVRMRKLEELDVSNNDLEDLPLLIVNCRSLKKIDLSGNRKIDSIEQITDGIFGLPQLESVILSTPYGRREYNRKEISKIKEQRLERSSEKIRDLQDVANQKIVKYILWSKNKTKVSDQDLKKSLEADELTIKKIQLKTRFLKQVERKLKVVELMRKPERSL